MRVDPHSEESSKAPRSLPTTLGIVRLASSLLTLPPLPAGIWSCFILTRNREKRETFTSACVRGTLFFSYTLCTSSFPLSVGWHPLKQVSAIYAFFQKVVRGTVQYTACSTASRKQPSSQFQLDSSRPNSVRVSFSLAASHAHNYHRSSTFSKRLSFDSELVPLFEKQS